jgi:hypothetical protein
MESENVDIYSGKMPQFESTEDNVLKAMQQLFIERVNRIQKLKADANES